MGGPVIRTARALHAWAGAILSVLMIVLSLSGALLVWKEDYLRLTMPEARTGFEASPANLAALSEQAEADFGAENIRLIVFGTKEFGLNKVYLQDKQFAYLGPDGEVLAAWSGTNRMEEWLFDLHHHLLAGHTGEIITGLIGLAMAVLIIAGLIAYWPTRKALKLGFRLRSLSRPHLLLSHRNIGLVTALPALVLLLTGTALVFDDQAKAMLAIFGTEDKGADRELSVDTAQGWQQIYGASQTALPGATVRMGIWPSERNAGPSMRVRQPGEWHPNGRSVISLPAPDRADILDAQAMSGGDRVYNSFYPLHAAKTGGLVYKLVVFIAGMALTFLGVLGLISFAKRLMGTIRQPRTLGSAGQAASAGSVPKQDSFPAE